MNIGIIGSGDVAQSLALGFIKHGHQVTLGTRHPDKLKPWNAANPKVKINSFADAVKFGELIVLAVKGSAAADALRQAGVANLNRKVVIDACNPIADAPPVHGVLQFFTGPNESLMERLQKEFPDAKFVKAFSCVGAPFMVNPQFTGGPPTMFICGNDADAKKTVRAILDQFGWETDDMGPVEAARAIEPLCILWCLPGFTKNEWTHALKMLR